LIIHQKRKKTISIILPSQSLFNIPLTQKAEGRGQKEETGGEKTALNLRCEEAIQRHSAFSGGHEVGM